MDRERKQADRISRRRGFAAVLAVLAAPAGLIPPPFADDPVASERFTFKEPHMGTEFTLVIYTPDPALASRASRLAFARIHAIDAALTDYDPNSELMRLWRPGPEARPPPSAPTCSRF